MNFLDRTMPELMLLAKALKEYQDSGKTTKQFEEEYGCEVVLDEFGYGIANIKFQNDSNETMFMLKYKL